MDDFDPEVTVRRCFQMAFVPLQLLTLSEKYFRFACFINCLVLFLNSHLFKEMLLSKALTCINKTGYFIKEADAYGYIVV